ncbi:MAG: NADH:ubiquinone oxidoreductase subunit NDUFA12 [Alphaproteobacteria bacterium]|nr:NADH:ubiquinone oxidoreductase subunit NDUFA12 [Alphaproteobacteria bacterium]
MQLLAELFIWWHKQTLGVRLWTAFQGRYVGSDAMGNRYYRGRKNDRRWVIFNGPADASAIPPGWHGWMHHRTDVPPTEDAYIPHSWEVPHQVNLTGSAAAYRPDGSILNAGRRPKVTGDYEAWSPDA